MSQFKIGTLNHVHVVVPDRAAAAAWYGEHLGLVPVEAVGAWAEVEGGPLHLSADGGASGIALFEVGHGHEGTTLEMGAGFAVDADAFLAFVRALSGPLQVRATNGKPMTAAAVVDLDLCYAFSFLDPWGNAFELNCYDVDEVKRRWIEPEGIEPVRYW